jgi:AcrR family transcriptional regulator
VSSPTPSVRERLVTAAFELFEERGFDGTTVDDIARAAGVGRSTFFRTFDAKEDVIFPEHDLLVGRMDERLRASASDSRRAALTDAARIVLRHYVEEGEIARARYRLTSRVSALRDREIAGLRLYQGLFRRHLAGWWAGEPSAGLRSELCAAAVVTAHNHVLRRWLRGETTSPEEEFDVAMDQALSDTFETKGRGSTVVMVLESTLEARRVQSLVRDVLAAHADDR